ELCNGLAWKLIKEHLAFNGVICKNPRDCFKAAKENDLIVDEMKWLQMIEDRNQLVHCYTYEQSREIYQKIKASHTHSLLQFYKKIKKDYGRR
ncbi:MAG: nucleotidyltransferase substrate binding protein, partial [Chitinophagales bacterium]|nr:nucleotidyltransferase substrate binding protein [Chitinophagales bacterium]